MAANPPRIMAHANSSPAMIPPLIPPVVSIVIPVYNAAAYLDACMESVCTQDFRSIEVVVVNDGSTDNSGDKLSAWAARDSRVVVVAHPENANRGVAASRNLGLCHMRGEYLWFVDADDRVRPGAVAHLVAIAKAQNADVVAFNAEETRAGFPRRNVYQQAKPASVVTGEEWVRLTCRQKESPHAVWLRFYRRAYLELCGLHFCEGNGHDDIPWITEGDLRAQRFVYSDTVLYDYVRNDKSITGSGSGASLLRRAEGLMVVVDVLRDINLRVQMSTETRALLRAELVGQGLQVDRLRRHIADPVLRRRLDERVKRTNFWRGLWKDATRFTRKRQLAQAMLRDLLHR